MEWSSEELAQMNSLIRLHDRRAMEELHNAIVEVITEHKATAQNTLMVVRLIEQEIINNYMLKLFPEKTEEAGVTTTPLPGAVKGPEEIEPALSESKTAPTVKKTGNKSKREKE